MSQPRSQEVHSGQTLDPGETIIWSGRPRWISLAVRSLGVLFVAGYFLLLTIYESVAASAHGMLSLALTPLFFGALGVAFLCGFAWAVARSTTYLITNRRVILRYGVAFPRNLSIPFRQIATMSVAVRVNQRGNIALTLRPENHMPYLKLWPHARPWALRHPEPMLRDVAAAGAVATVFARVLQQSGEAPQKLEAAAIAA